MLINYSMNPFEELKQPGVYQFDISALVGPLEIEITIPDSPDWNKMALLGHPHSLHGGTMQNKVVSTMLRAYRESRIPAIRFNFRGVGLSAGSYDSGIGESQDMLFLAKLWREIFPDVQLCFAGFSFGSFVAYRAAALYEQQYQTVSHLISVAPSVVNYNYAEFPFDSKRWSIIQGEEDEVISAEAVFDFALTKDPSIPVIRFAQTGHFFHGKLIELKEKLLTIIQE